VMGAVRTRAAAAPVAAAVVAGDVLAAVAAVRDRLENRLMASNLMRTAVAGVCSVWDQLWGDMIGGWDHQRRGNCRRELSRVLVVGRKLGVEEAAGRMVFGSAAEGEVWSRIGATKGRSMKREVVVVVGTGREAVGRRLIVVVFGQKACGFVAEGRPLDREVEIVEVAVALVEAGTGMALDHWVAANL
jgi:hypothetical protein